MMPHSRLPSSARALVVALTCACGPMIAHASGFQLGETSASGLGTAYAGGAAQALDATTVWSNPAGMSLVGDSQISGALHLITPSLKFRDGSSRPATAQGLGGNGGDAGSLAPVPNFYLVKPIDSRISVGLGVNAPWGLVTEYDPGWAGRFQAIKSSIRTINVNPSLSYKASDSLSMGVGLDIQHMSAEFTNQVNYAGALLSAAALNGIAPGSAGFNAIAAATAGLESGARVKGSDNAYGWNAGLLWSLNDSSRVGLHYRSSMKYRLDGTVGFTNPALPAGAPAITALLAGGVNATRLFDSAITSDVKIPAIVNVSYFTRLDDRWDLMADAQWTQWSTIKNLTFIRANGAVLQNTPENFKNTWKVAIGANYHYSPQWTLRGGLAFDKSPVQRIDRTARLPDADRTMLTLGAQYTVNPKLTLDMGAGYVFIKTARINANGGNPGDPAAALANGLLNGQYDSRAVILSAQLNYRF